MTSSTASGIRCGDRRALRDPPPDLGRRDVEQRAGQHDSAPAGGSTPGRPAHGERSQLADPLGTVPAGSRQLIRADHQEQLDVRPGQQLQRVDRVARPLPVELDPADLGVRLAGERRLGHPRRISGGDAPTGARCGGEPAGMISRRSSSSRNRASWAITRWPTWGGSNSPPNTPEPHDHPLARASARTSAGAGRPGRRRPASPRRCAARARRRAARARRPAARRRAGILRIELAASDSISARRSAACRRRAARRNGAALRRPRPVDQKVGQLLGSTARLPTPSGGAGTRREQLGDQLVDALAGRAGAGQVGAQGLDQRGRSGGSIRSILDRTTSCGRRPARRRAARARGRSRPSGGGCPSASGAASTRWISRRARSRWARNSSPSPSPGWRPRAARGRRRPSAACRRATRRCRAPARWS